MSVDKDNLMEEPRSGGIQVIARASAVMRSLAVQPQGLSLAAIAQAVGLPRSTVQRIIGALETEDLVEALPGSGYRLGPGLHQLIHQAHGDIISFVRDSLEQLGESLGETVALSCIRGQQSNVIIRAISEHELRVVIPLGRSLPMHATSDGKVLLSTLSDEEIGRWIAAAPEKLTGRTLDLPGLLAQMPGIRRDGIAVDVEEHAPGVSAISALLPTFMGPHAVTVVAPTARFEARQAEFRQALETFREDFKRARG
ncbi:MULTISPECIES: IclR family transcriptional regulator [Pseudomonas]|uniref:IclR family transcriptional regulator n=1 Tax=Pseudomonas TaxID=286 RepID=UPI000C86A96A|nr:MULTISPECIES: IclR family transcriptional regulator [Pseudomonas]MDQ2483299.1 IclR family transcriptional regulator [Pseudomonas putida]PMU27645.1 IclR family transcriptional regulator [Pseudomonas sp. GP01-A9]PMU32813.1 IclR family transcriptional regulator [Pseudomonas sp. GP01-A13]PMU45065.1 IclR family transcriptional regulator [Pseudomonas sp. GP01-A8]PMU56874.1 IclR family transcriptional regulator [Pseudomonas sp. GP01-A14]